MIAHSDIVSFAPVCPSITHLRPGSTGVTERAIEEIAPPRIFPRPSVCRLTWRQCSRHGRFQERERTPTRATAAVTAPQS
jgi:hypothetical protein